MPLLDAVIIVAYLLGMVLLGALLGRRQVSLEDYFVAGRSVGWRLLGLSLLGTSVSTISYLSLPGEIVANGPALLISNLVFPLSYLIVAYGLIPAYFKYGTATIFEYLEARFDHRVRLAGVAVFLLMRIVWMALIIFTASLALTALVELPTQLIVVVVGLVATVYTSIGGIRADIVSDAVQTLILFFGALLSLYLVLSSIGGVEPVLSSLGGEGGVEVPWLSWGQTSFVGAFIWALFINVCILGTDQVMVQRFFCARTLREARRGLLFSFLGTVVFSVILSILGLALLSYFQSHDLSFSAEFPGGVRAHADKLFPFFIGNLMPAGLSGLVLAALLAAAMSSLDSGINSSITVIEIDLRSRSGGSTGRPLTLEMTRKHSLVLGLLVTALALLVPKLEGNLLQVSAKLGSWLEGSLAGVFLLGIWFRRATPASALFGGLVGVVLGVTLSYSEYLFGVEPVSFTWIIPTSLIATVTAGVLTGRRPWLRPGIDAGEE